MTQAVTWGQAGQERQRFCFSMRREVHHAEAAEAGGEDPG